MQQVSLSQVAQRVSARPVQRLHGRETLQLPPLSIASVSHAQHTECHISHVAQGLVVAPPCAESSASKRCKPDHCGGLSV
eukprot:1126674-Amphidinium_carterae.1